MCGVPVVGEDSHKHHHDEHADGHDADDPSQLVEGLLQGRQLGTTLRLEVLCDDSDLCLHACGADNAFAVAVGHAGRGETHVLGEWLVGVVHCQCLAHLLRLTGEQCFVCEDLRRLKQPHVGRHLVARADEHDVARNAFLGVDVGLLAVTDDLAPRRRHGRQLGQCVTCGFFHVGGERRVERDDDEDGDALDPLLEAQRHDGRRQQQQHHRRRIL
mmetsp:Transcript_52505/g.131974  ORF Transcript_52505/g.131974 Transcript_52505/m.131974 type:complete len:215 (+) Transcript_52505:3357-4001(+)